MTWAFEIGMCDGLSGDSRAEPSPRIGCDCMRNAWSPPGLDAGQRWPPHRPHELLIELQDYYYSEPSLPFQWLDPPPGGWYGPGFCPRAAARRLTTQDMILFDSDDLPRIESYPSFGRV